MTSFCINLARTSKSIQHFCHFSSSIPEYLIPVIPKDSIKKSFSRSPGPGGQNVNNVATKAEIRFNLNDSWIPNELKPIIIKNYGYRLNKGNEIVINSSKTRTQTENLNDCFEKLHDMLNSCAILFIQDERKIPNVEDSKVLDARRERAEYFRRLEKERHSIKKRSRTKIYD